MKINIKKAVKESNMTRKEIAPKIGCNVQWLTNVQNPDKFPKSIRLLYKLSKLSGIPMEKLITK